MFDCDVTESDLLYIPPDRLGLADALCDALQAAIDDARTPESLARLITARHEIVAAFGLEARAVKRAKALCGRRAPL